ncbi:hypothetical protein NXX91_21935 [Bacteroides thetaiotaomicron]|nr:hypothetical protein [Bacteroides thetaiotaomicron]
MTEEEKYGMERLAEYLDMRIRNEEKSIKENRDKLDRDYLLSLCVERGGSCSSPISW